MPFIINPLGTIFSNPIEFPEQTSESNIPDKTSYLGTPVFSNLEIPAGNYTTLDGRKVNFDGIRIDSVLFVVSQQKNIITTPIQGLDGTIKEYISAGDFAISCSGLIIGESTESNRTFTVDQNGNNYPETDVRRLIEITKTPISIEIISNFLEMFEIRNVVIESFSLGQIPGQKNGQPFELRMISDTPIQLTEL